MNFHGIELSQSGHFWDMHTQLQFYKSHRHGSVMKGWHIIAHKNSTLITKKGKIFARPTANTKKNQTVSADLIHHMKWIPSPPAPMPSITSPMQISSAHTTLIPVAKPLPLSGLDASLLAFLQRIFLHRFQFQYASHTRISP